MKNSGQREVTKRLKKALVVLNNTYGPQWVYHPDREELAQTIIDAGCLTKSEMEKAPMRYARKMIKDICEFLIQKGLIHGVDLKPEERGGRRIGLEHYQLVCTEPCGLKAILTWAKGVSQMIVNGKRSHPQTCAVLVQISRAMIRGDYNPTWPLDGKQVHAWMMQTYIPGKNCTFKKPSKQMAYNLCQRILDIVRIAPPPGFRLSEPDNLYKEAASNIRN